MLTKLFDRCSAYYGQKGSTLSHPAGSRGAAGHHSTTSASLQTSASQEFASEEEKRYSALLFNGLFDALADKV